MKNEEFYIGWMEKAPDGFAKFVKRVFLVLLAMGAITGVLLALSQKKFSTGNFEFGKLTAVKGIYFTQPFPFLKAVNGKDILGRPSFITIPLIGFGKTGAAGVIAAIEKQKNRSLNRKEVTMHGTLLYNDGKLLMQVDANDSVVTNITDVAEDTLLPLVSNLREQEIHGEIVDPKCFFGVMKPGQGKPHKDCAIRCILGGIPPVLRVQDEEGNENYCLILGENGEQMNEAVQHFVAEPVTLRARVVKYDDWIILYIKNKSITPFSYLRAHFGNAVAACGPACMK